MKELLAEPQTSPSEREWQRFRLSVELVNAQESQYTRVKNEERWNRLEQEFYPALCVIAKTQGGRVELNIKEDTLIGQLVYIGEGLTLGSSNPEGLAAFSRIVAAAIVNAMCNTGHSPRHTRFLNLAVKGSVRILKSPVAVILNSG